MMMLVDRWGLKAEVGGTKNDNNGGNKNRRFSFINVSIYVYVIVMALLFFNQAALSIHKYLQKEIVEDVSTINKLAAMVPPMTFCLLPGYKLPLDLQQGSVFSSYCDRNTTDFKQCLEDIKFNVSELVMATFQYPNVNVAPPDFSVDWHPSSHNLYTGSCFTYQRRVEEPRSQLIAETIMLNMNDNELAHGYSLLVFVHNPDMFIPSLGISADYVGQQYMSVNPEVHGVYILNIDPTERIHLNTDTRKCVTDPEYNVVQCMENYVTEAIGCHSPFDYFPPPVGSRQCETFDEWDSLFHLHRSISLIGAPQFQNLTGCLPPCQYEHYAVELTSVKSDTFANILKDSNGMGIMVSLRNTNTKVVREAMLYELHNLVGEIGGCLGMFLGVSLISLYQLTLGIVQRAVKYV